MALVWATMRYDVIKFIKYQGFEDILEDIIILLVLNEKIYLSNDVELISGLSCIVI